MNEIAKNIRKIVGNDGYETYVCKVTGINAATCDVIRVYDDKEIKAVRLNAHILEKSGLIISPKQGSFVLVTSIDGNQYFVSQFSEVERITLDVDAEIIINGGANGGMVLSEKIATELNRVIDRCNDIVATINSLAVAMTGTGTAPVLGESLGSAITAAISPIFVSLSQSEKTTFENDKIKH